MTEFEDISLEEMISDGFDIVAQEINIDDLAETEKIPSKNIPDPSCKKYGDVPQCCNSYYCGKKSIYTILEEAQKNGDFIGIVSQKNSDLEQPAEKDLYQTGTLAKIIKIIKLPEGNITAITKGFTDLK
jgi:ATP-dependent Lon protease